ncbi:MAG TPA: uracil-DNA glycosylase family protein [Spirochaetia bacterium]
MAVGHVGWLANRRPFGYLRPVDTTDTARRLVAATRRLSRAVGRLTFSPPVGYVANPLDYARAPHEAYLARYAAGPKRIVFLGMNPGPWGMAQTGVPFGDIDMVRDWLGISGRVVVPEREHPRVPIRGFDSTRGEVSGARLWGMLRDRYGTAAAMARELFVANYCPLLFLDVGGRNLTPDRIGRADQGALFAACDECLRTLVEVLRPQWLVGVGQFAEKRLLSVAEKLGETAPRVMGIMHPSPANPRAQNDWAGQVTAALVEAGVWSTGGRTRR